MKKKIVRAKKNTWKLKWKLETEDYLAILISVLVCIFIAVQCVR